MSVAVWVGVALLGGLGSVARHLIARAVLVRAPLDVPVAILAINVAGAFALGVLVGAGVGGDALLLAGTGLVGAFTTFSTWMHEAHAGGRRAGTANVVVSLVLGLAAATLGYAVG